MSALFYFLWLNWAAVIYAIYIVNIAMAGLIVLFELRSGSDKTLFVSVSAFIGLLVINWLFMLAARFDREARKKQIHWHFFYCTMLMVAVVLVVQIAASY